jgi:hypothetical protein
VTKIIQNTEKNRSLSNRQIRESTTKIETTTVMFILLNVISCFTLLQHEITFDKVHPCKKHEITFHRVQLFQFWLLIPGFVYLTDFDFFRYFVLFLSLDSFLGDRYFVVTCYYIGWVNNVSRFKFKNCKHSHQTTLKFCIFKIKTAEI